MAYYCPKCGTPVEENIFFQVTGQCMCSNCGEIVDLTSASEIGPNREFDDKQGQKQD